MRDRIFHFDTLATKHLYAMGWLRLVDSLKLEVAFAEYGLFYRALLQKRPIILRRLLIVGTPDRIPTRTYFVGFGDLAISESQNPFQILSSQDTTLNLNLI